MPFIDNFMPLWGPYSKKYMGLSKIIPSLADTGARFDLTVHPTMWNSAVAVPNVTIPSDYHLWECAGDYSYYAYRYELMWKDEVYADVSFSKMIGGAYLMRCEFVNNTSLHQNLILNIFASLEFPFYSYVKVNAPGSAVIINANDYAEFEYAKQRPWDTETPDGMKRGMFRDEKFYLCSGLGDRCDHSHTEFYGFKPFGCEKGDRVTYNVPGCPGENTVIALRYRCVTPGDALFELNGREISLPHSDELNIAYYDYDGSGKIELVSLGGAGIELDFTALTDCENSVSTVTEKYNYTPEINTRPCGRGFVTSLDYGYDGCRFNIYTHNKNTRQRVLESGCLEDALINRLSNGDVTYDRLKETFSRSFREKTSDEGFFHNTLIKSIFVEPHSRRTEYAVISQDDFEMLTDEEYEEIYLAAKKKSGAPEYNEDGRKYELSTGILRATLLTNTVYPVFLRDKNVVHHTPGKRWDSFYTWDSGLIGTGLLEFSNDLCRYALETYLSEDDNKDFDFLLHGSLVPTQFEEYYELLKRTEDKHSLDSIYPKMRRYYEFLRGRSGSSTCDKFGNGLLTVYDYWYSCSGMDDYPAQSKMIENRAEAYSCPCLPTSHIIRAGKILRAVAEFLGREEDIAVYDRDIEKSERALNELAWDEESGYFGYTLYDRDPAKPYIMRTPEGENSNRGFDGVYPLFAGAVTGERRDRLLAHVKNPDEMWSPAGISAVDMSASYYMDDGYWNGNVWMSHQFFFWKTMLDLGETDFAFEIADRALEMWKAETDFSYYTYECFGIKTRRGGWFHNFGGLSAPVCVWANAYYKPGTVTSGYDLWTDYQRTGDNYAEIKFRYNGKNDRYSVIVTLDGSGDYKAVLDTGESCVPAEFNRRTAGALEFTFDSAVRQGILKIEEV